MKIEWVCIVLLCVTGSAFGMAEKTALAEQKSKEQCEVSLQKLVLQEVCHSTGTETHCLADLAHDGVGLLIYEFATLQVAAQQSGMCTK